MHGVTTTNPADRVAIATPLTPHSDPMAAPSTPGRLAASTRQHANASLVVNLPRMSKKANVFDRQVRDSRTCRVAIGWL
jgi:hypothetical protein